MGGAESANFILSPGGSSNRSQVTWQTLLDLVAYYADELSRPASTGESSKSVSEGFRRSASGTFESDGAPSTAYYCDYVADNAADGQGASVSQGGDQGGGENSSASSSRKRFELDEQDRFTLLSILTLISNVSSRCTKARFDILAISAAQSESGIGGPTMQTLFTLALCPLPADIRGLAFVAIANLIRAQPNKMSSEQDKEKALAQGKEAWRILERTQILPIGLLGQYAPMPDASRFTAAPGVPDAEVRCIMESGSNYYENEKVRSIFMICRRGFLSFRSSQLLRYQLRSMVPSITSYFCCPHSHFLFLAENREGRRGIVIGMVSLIVRIWHRQ